MHLENLVIDAAKPRRRGRITVEGGPWLDLCFPRVQDPRPIEAPRLHLDLTGGARQAGSLKRDARRPGPAALRDGPR